MRKYGLNEDVDVNEELVAAVDAKNAEEVKSALEAGADPNSEDDIGNLVLAMAAYDGLTGILELLINAGADVDMKNRYKDTALLLAAKRGRTNCVKLLIDAGADVNVGNRYKETALHISARSGFVNCVKLLISAGANLDARDHNGYTPLVTSARSCMKALIDAGANLEIPLYVNVTVFQDNAATKILLDAGADPDTDGDGWSETPLTCASRRGDIECVNMLLGAGADVNVKEKGGYTALMWAVYWEHADVCELLLNAGADPNLKDDDGRTAFDIAKTQKTAKIRKILRPAIKNFKNR